MAMVDNIVAALQAIAADVKALQGRIRIELVTQTEYDAIVTKDPAVLYVVTGP